MKRKNRKKLSKNHKKIGLKKVKHFAIFTMVIQIIAFALSLFSKKSAKEGLKNLITDEQKDIKNLIDGREDLPTFFHRSLNHFKDFFIPHAGNDHKPHSVRTKSLIIYILLAVMVKLTATGTLYILYPSPGRMSELVASKMLELTNRTREEMGIHPLRLDPVLTAAAEVKGRDMILRNYFAHDTPDGKRPWEWIDKSKYDYVYAGENLAMGFNQAEFVQQAFMESPAHKKNILNENYRDVGLAVVNGEIDGKKTDILVEMFGALRNDVFLAQEIVGNKTITNSEVAENDNTTSEKPEEFTPEVSDTNNLSFELLQQQDTNSNIPTVEAQAEGDDFLADDSMVVAGEESWENSFERENEENINEGILLVASTGRSSKSLFDWIIEISNIIFIAFIIFITISLILNIFIKIRIQHSHLIVQSIVVLALLSSLIISKLHFLESISSTLRIL